MIVVYSEDGDTHACEDATRFSTDEHNNLCIWGGKNTDLLLGLFHPSEWRKVLVEDVDQD